MFFRHFKKQINVLLWTNALVVVASGMLAPIYALYVKRIGGDLMDASITATMFFLSAGITSLLSGRLIDRIKEDEWVIVIGYLLMGLGYILYMLIRTPSQLFFVQILMGFSEALYYPALDTLYSKYIDNQKRAGITWGSFEGMYYFTTAAGAILGGVIAKIFSFNYIFVVMAAFCIISAVYIALLPRKLL